MARTIDIAGAAAGSAVLLRVNRKTGEAIEAVAPGKPIRFPAGGSRVLAIVDDAALAARVKTADRVPLSAREKIVDVDALLAGKRARLDAMKTVRAERPRP